MVPAVTEAELMAWRRQRGRNMLAGYIVDTGLSHDDPQSVLGDMLADLMHMADADDLDFERALSIGYEHHAEERADYARA